MGCTRMSKGLMCAVAAGLLAVAPVANAQDTMGGTTTTMSGSTTTTTTTTGGDMGMSGGMTSSMSMQAMPVSGSVVRYYVDRSGYVTAMDLQTTDGVQFVRFSPSMGQRLYTAFPPGSANATVYVVGSPTTRWDAVGLTAPAPGTMSSPYMVSDAQLLESEPYILPGAQMVTVTGQLQNLIVSNTGEVVGMVLDNNTLVRVPREVRHHAPGHAGTERVSALFKGADISVTGYPEAPMYGVLSRYPQRIIGSAISVNGKNVGAIGVPMMNPRSNSSLLNVDIGGTQQTAEETRASGMGYTTYTPDTSMMMGAGTGTTTGSMGNTASGTATTGQ